MGASAEEDLPDHLGGPEVLGGNVEEDAGTHGEGAVEIIGGGLDRTEVIPVLFAPLRVAHYALNGTMELLVVVGFTLVDVAVITEGLVAWGGHSIPALVCSKRVR